MADDPALATAYSSSLRSVVLPYLDPEGQFSTQTVLYLDSKAIQYHLQLLNVDAHSEEEQGMHKIIVFSDFYYFYLFCFNL